MDTMLKQQDNKKTRQSKERKSNGCLEKSFFVISEANMSHSPVDQVTARSLLFLKMIWKNTSIISKKNRTISIFFFWVWMERPEQPQDILMRVNSTPWLAVRTMGTKSLFFNFVFNLPAHGGLEPPNNSFETECQCHTSCGSLATISIFFSIIRSTY